MTSQSPGRGAPPGFSPGRRRLVLAAPWLLAAGTLAGCDAAPAGRTAALLRRAQRFNDWFQAKVFDPERPAPEYADHELTPESGFRVNGYDTDHPPIDIAHWTLAVSGLVSKPGAWSAADITALPKRVMNTRHCCVEGWSIIVRWGGTPLRDFLNAVGADPGARYLAVNCGDGYYTSYDLASARHAQTLLCYEAYDRPLALEHGAPVRIVMPVKLGYKSAKWIRALIVTNEKPGGYWEDQGYDWFAGI